MRIEKLLYFSLSTLLIIAISLPFLTPEAYDYTCAKKTYIQFDLRLLLLSSLVIANVILLAIYLKKGDIYE